MNRKVKKVLFICKGHPNIAGAQLYLKHISSIFISRNYELHFALHKNDGLYVFREITRRGKVFTWEYDWRHISSIASFRQGLKILKKIKPNIIIFNSQEDQIIPCLWAAYFSRISKKLLVVHWSESSNSLPIFRRKKWLPFLVPSRYSVKLRLIRSISYRLLSGIIFVNNITRIAYKKLYCLPSGKLATIYNGIEVNKFNRLRFNYKESRQIFGITPNEFFIVSLGNLTEVKGHKYLISSIFELVKQKYSLKCLIGGEGELEQELRKQIQDLGLENIIILPGYMKDRYSVLAAADILCMPSLNEALPYSILEAMVAGVPVIASEVGGIPEVITNGKNGLLVPAANIPRLSQAIEKLLVDINLRHELGKKGQEHIKRKFSLQIMLQKTNEFYRQQLTI